MEQRKGKREDEKEETRMRRREREIERKRRVGDEGALPARSVEKGDRGGYRVVAWVCASTGLAEGREG